MKKKLSIILGLFFLISACSGEPSNKLNDDRFVKSEKGVITDNKTGLQWYVDPEIYMTWDELDDWLNNLSVEGGGWRWPTIKELKSLYQKGEGENNLNGIFNFDECCVWSGEEYSLLEHSSPIHADANSDAILMYDFSLNAELPCSKIHTTNRWLTFAVRAKK